MSFSPSLTGAAAGTAEPAAWTTVSASRGLQRRRGLLVGRAPAPAEAPSGAEPRQQRRQTPLQAQRAVLHARRMNASGSAMSSPSVGISTVNPTWTPKVCRIIVFYRSWAIILHSSVGPGKPYKPQTLARCWRPNRCYPDTAGAALSEP